LKTEEMEARFKNTTSDSSITNHQRFQKTNRNQKQNRTLRRTKSPTFQGTKVPLLVQRQNHRRHHRKPPLMYFTWNTKRNKFCKKNLNCSSSKILRSINTKLSPTKSSKLDEEDEVWKPHLYLTRPRRMSFSFFNSMNLIVWGGVFPHQSGYL